MITILKNGKRHKYFTASTKNVVNYIEKLTKTSMDDINFKYDKVTNTHVFYVGNDCYTICY